MDKSRDKSSNLRALAELFRATAAAADKVADAVETGNDQQLEDATKEFMWQAIKLQQASN